MPGHGAFSRFALLWRAVPGWLHRSNVSMTTMRPPQPGTTGGRSRLFRGFVFGRRRDAQQFASECEAGLAGRASEQAIMADAVEPTRQDMEQEAADELVGGKRHDALAISTVATIVLVAEGNSGFVGGDKAAVRDGDPVSIARQVGEHRLGSGEGRLGIDHPALAANRLQMTQEGPTVGEVRRRSEEGEPRTA